MTREKAIEILKGAIKKPNTKDGYLGQALDMAIKSLEQEPKTGHWKRISIDKYVQHAMAYYKCSVCDKDIIGTHNYCPNCGAKMSEIPTSPERNGKEESEVQE